MCEFEKAAVILSFDADFLCTHPQRLRYARQFTNARRVLGGKQEMNRLYQVETTPTISGTMAEHRLPLTSAEIEDFVWQLVHELGGPDGPNREQRESSHSPTVPPDWLSGLLNDLKRHRGASIVIPGEWQPPIVQALAHWLNQTLGNVGNTIHYSKPAEAHPLNQLQSLGELVQAIKTGEIEALFILGGNPAYTVPVDLEFADALPHVKRSIHLGTGLDETAALCTWHIPQTHYLESWSDARSYDGTVSFQQPLIAPLYRGKSPHELLGAFTQQQPVRSDYEIVHEFWRTQALWPDFEKGWRQALHDGFIAGTTAPMEPVQLNPRFLQTSARGERRADKREMLPRQGPSDLGCWLDSSIHYFRSGLRRTNRQAGATFTPDAHSFPKRSSAPMSSQELESGRTGEVWEFMNLQCSCATLPARVLCSPRLANRRCNIPFPAPRLP